MNKQRKKSAKSTENVNESWFLPDDKSLQKQQDEHNRRVNPEVMLAAVTSWMEENLPEPEQASGEAVETQPSPSGEVSWMMEEYGVDRQTAEKWADMI
jgi:hypothetical protein